MFKKIPINYISAFVILLAVILWVLSGVLFKDSDEIEIIAEDVEENVITVRASEFLAEDKTYFLTVRGRTEVDKKVLLKPKTSSTVIKKLDKGVFVSKNESICVLDPENRTAALDEAVANKNKAQLQYDAIKQLAIEGYRSENAVATAEAALKGAIARVEIATNELNNLLSVFDKFSYNIFVHVHLLNKLEKKYTSEKTLKLIPKNKNKNKISKKNLIAMLSQLKGFISRLKDHKSVSTWDDYSTNNSYSNEDKNKKIDFVSKFCKENNIELMKKILEIKDADIEDGGTGAFYIFLKKKL